MNILCWIFLVLLIFVGIMIVGFLMSGMNFIS